MSLLALGFFALIVVVVFLFLLGLLPVPVGYDRGKIQWVMWCGTGMHIHVVYWHDEETGLSDTASFQAIHPEDLS